MDSTSRKISSTIGRFGYQDPAAEDDVQSSVEEVLAGTQFIDMHTHLFSAGFGRLGLWGIDELLTYHYLEAEFFRSSDFTPDLYWSLSKKDRADAIWRALFVENSPLSEATRGVIAVLDAFDLPTDSPDLAEARSFFAAQTAEAHTRRVLELGGVSRVVMTNDPLDPDEARAWMNGVRPDPQFLAVLRLDRIVRGWSESWQVLSGQGYKVDAGVSGTSITEIRKFLSHWYERMSPVYMAVSLPYTFQFPEDTAQSKILSEAVLPACGGIRLAVVSDDRSALPGESSDSAGRRRGWQSRPRRARISVPELS